MIGPRDGVLFLFGGEGGEHERMGRTLAGRYPIFAEAVTAAGDAVAAAGGPRVWTPRYGFRQAVGSTAAPEQAAAQSHPEFVQPALFAFQVAIAELLAAWGVRPDAVAGHGIGEAAAAVTAGALSLAEGAKVAVARGRAAGRMAGSGAVAELLTSESEAIRLVRPMAEKVTIAAINGPRSVLVSGTSRYVDVVVRRAERRGIVAARTSSDHPAHSPAMAEVVPRFLGDLGPIRPTVPRIPLYSGVHGGTVVDSAEMSPAYWAENITRRVELGMALLRAAEDGLSMILEIGPEPLLATAVRAVPEFAHTTYGTADRTDEGTAFLTCLAQLHATRALGGGITETGRDGAPRPLPHRTGTAVGENGERQETSPAEWENAPGGYGTGLPAVSFGTSGSCGVPGRSESSEHEDTADPDRLPNGEDLRAEATGAGTLASVRLADSPPPTDIIAWTRVVDANRAIRFIAGRVALDPPMTIDRSGTYVVSGGLGALGSVMVRRLLAAGARDVVVPTRSPRPVPPLLEGLEDRIVVVRCDTADRHDLDNALRDIRETGCTIRGVVHAAQVFEDTTVGVAVSADTASGSVCAAQEPGAAGEDREQQDPDLDAGRLARRFARISAAAANLIELTAADPVAFIAVFSTPIAGTPRPAGPITRVSWSHTETKDTGGPADGVREY
ncbi:acyltransferase domain-containing protein [Nocardia sp. NBC_01329]|uniref:acyltransferase domain-containing protein n=1 Tax=Nocardia sp. NBC_01329 TaxID=2903594 RepID=UPI002E144587|nr:acyltransferase domain-containing protein [Nocardia sp. NBC_01329]